MGIPNIFFHHWITFHLLECSGQTETEVCHPLSQPLDLDLLLFLTKAWARAFSSPNQYAKQISAQNLSIILRAVTLHAHTLLSKNDQADITQEPNALISPLHVQFVKFLSIIDRKSIEKLAKSCMCVERFNSPIVSTLLQVIVELISRLDTLKFALESHLPQIQLLPQPDRVETKEQVSQEEKPKCDTDSFNDQEVLQNWPNPLPPLPRPPSTCHVLDHGVPSRLYGTITQFEVDQHPFYTAAGKSMYNSVYRTLGFRPAPPTFVGSSMYESVYEKLKFKPAPASLPTGSGIYKSVFECLKFEPEYKPVDLGGKLGIGVRVISGRDWDIERDGFAPTSSGTIVGIEDEDVCVKWDSSRSKQKHKYSQSRQRFAIRIVREQNGKIVKRYPYPGPEVPELNMGVVLRLAPVLSDLPVHTPLFCFSDPYSNASSGQYSKLQLLLLRQGAMGEVNWESDPPIQCEEWEEMESNPRVDLRRVLSQSNDILIVGSIEYTELGMTLPIRGIWKQNGTFTLTEILPSNQSCTTNGLNVYRDTLLYERETAQAINELEKMAAQDIPINQLQSQWLHALPRGATFHGTWTNDEQDSFHIAINADLHLRHPTFYDYHIQGKLECSTQDIFLMDEHAHGERIMVMEQTSGMVEGDGRTMLLGTRGFSHGLHYWEVHVDNADFGAVFIGVAKRKNKPGLTSVSNLSSWRGKNQDLFSVT